MTQANYPSLKEKNILITGGASGIGAEIVKAFEFVTCVISNLYASLLKH